MTLDDSILALQRLKDMHGGDKELKVRGEDFDDSIEEIVLAENSSYVIVVPGL